MKADRGNPGSEEWIVLWDAATGKVVQKAWSTAPNMDVLAVVLPMAARSSPRPGRTRWRRHPRCRDPGRAAGISRPRRPDHRPRLAPGQAHSGHGFHRPECEDLEHRNWPAVGGIARPCERSHRTRLMPQRPAPRLRGQWQPHPHLGTAVAPTTSPLPPNLPTAGKTSSPGSPPPPSCRPAPAGAWKTARSFSPGKGNSWRLLLPGNLAGASYSVRVKLRQIAAKEAFNLHLACGGRSDGEICP